jgi:hypothetical protein
MGTPSAGDLSRTSLKSLSISQSGKKTLKKANTSELARKREKSGLLNEISQNFNSFS